MIGKTRVCPNSNPFFNGVSLAVKTITGEASGTSYTLTEDDFTILADATAGVVTVNLPDATTCKGRVYVIKKIDTGTNAVTIDGNGSQTIDGDTSVNISNANEVRVIQSDGANWYVIGPLNITITSP